MKTASGILALVALSLLAPVGGGGGASAGADRPGPGGLALLEESATGLVQFTQPPEITICFCGSYALVASKGETAYFLFSEEIDLSKYVGKEVAVRGTPFTTACSGTLLMSCGFLDVTHIEPLAPTALETGTWGLIKSLYE